MQHTPTIVRRRAFTLLELLVVIGIVVLLAGLVLAVSSSVIRASEERATRNTLTVLDTALEEYERTLDRRITYRSGAYTGYTADPLTVAGVLQ
ncbi:MAG: type II secretion system protein, partial [Planctomycetota bacterium]